ncbi:hypothetical protein HNP84_002070 [Thermocatellispora tengchongensis]|uniref:Uncharacterized protein n=1 Tax=Thermocatellispora tengchongensis TaxID=1073253 RepID=A0A840NUD6_9ACTN|nr:hypothetical protein [Thermocatellispora tengchongensis]MBB5132354.1 hypothetical protein [Thermocatellispora tengchongensis]
MDRGEAVGPGAMEVTTPGGGALADEVAASARAHVAGQGVARRGGGVEPGGLLPGSRDSGGLGVSALGAERVREVAGLVGRLTGLDLAGAYRSLPKGLPLLTYRVCAESDGVRAACSGPLPLLKPVGVDVTGDGTADVVADLVPAPDLGEVVAAARAPLAALTRSEARRRGELAGKISARLGFVSWRLPGGDTEGGPLRAQVWAEYEVPASAGFAAARRVSIGFDGLRRGASLSGLDWVRFAAAPDADSPATVVVRAEARREEAGASVATVAGVGDVAGDRPTLLSLAQAPVPGRTAIRAAFEKGALASTVSVSSSAPATLDALALTRDRFTHLTLDRPRSQVTATIGRAGGGAGVRFAGGAAVDRAELRDYAYRGGALVRALVAGVTGLPPAFAARYETRGGAPSITVTGSAPHPKAAELLYYDAARGRTVVRAKATGLAARLSLTADPARAAIAAEAAAPVGSLDAVLQRGGGAVSSPRGAHATLIKDGAALGVSARLTGVKRVDVRYGRRPHAALSGVAGDASFVAAASVDRTHLARVELSNTPAEVRVDVDPRGRRAAFRAGGVIDRVRAAYANTRTGPTIDGTMRGVRSGVAASWDLGARTVASVAAAALARAEVYVNRAYVTRPGGAQEVRVAVDGVRGRVTATADVPGRRLDWTADRPVTAVSAFARVRAGDRVYRVAATARGVPARFEAAWGPGTYRFRGLTGPLGSAAVAVANHDGATAPSGPHLAAHYEQATGDLDASVRVDGLSSAEFTGTGAGFTADVRGKGQAVALDADVRLAGDLRFGALGTLGPVPGRLTVTAAPGGVIGYDTHGAALDLRAEVWLGKAAALAGGHAPGPAIPGTPGVSLADRGCAAGSPGCAKDTGPFCTPSRGCFGLRGYVGMRLPAKVTVDLARRTASFSGYRPESGRLAVYLAGSVLPPLPVRAVATLDGLPPAVTGLALGPLETGTGAAGGAIRAGYRLDPPSAIASLAVTAQADTGGPYGVVRGRLELAPVPAAVSVTGTYGAKTRIAVANSGPIGKLVAKVTVVPRGARAGTGLVRFTDVPARFTLAADAASGGLRVPTLGYRAEGGENTLDGLFAVEGPLVARVRTAARARLLGASFRVRDLAADTTVRLNPDLSVDLVSRPVPTGLLEAHAGLSVEPVRRQRARVRREIPYTGGLAGFALDGHVGFGPSTIGDFSVAVHRMSWLKIRPGKVPFGLSAPPALGYVMPGFEGAYDRVDVRAEGVDLRPDVDIVARIDRKVGPDVFRDRLRLGRATSLSFRRYDGRMRPISARQPISVGPAEVACLAVSTRPGPVTGGGENAITLRGADGPQLVTLLDPGGQVNGYALDLLAYFMSPYPGASWEVTGVDAGGCR